MVLVAVVDVIAPELPLKTATPWPVGVVASHETTADSGPPVAGTVEGVKAAVQPLGSPETLGRIGAVSVTEGLK